MRVLVKWNSLVPLINSNMQAFSPTQKMFLIPLSCILSVVYRKPWLNLHLMNFLFLKSLIPTLAIAHTFLLSVPIQFSFYSDPVA